MNKDNLLFGIIGVLLGFIIGLIFAINAQQRTPTPRAPASAQSIESAPEPQSLPANTAPGQNATPQALLDAAQKAKNEPKNFAAQMAAAQFFYESRQYDQAIALYQQANQLQPDNYETVVALGNAYFDAGRYELAEKWYTTALSRKPDDVNVRTDLGLTFFFRQPRDTDRAIKEFRASLLRDPKHEQTHINLIVALSEKGDTKETQAALAQFEKASPNSSALPKLRARIESMTNK